MMSPDCRSGQSVKLTFLSKLSLIIAMVGDWGEPVDKEELIPHICHGSHGYTRVKIFLAGVNFYRFNAKNWLF